ncbi:MAG: hypothetical protein GY833_17345 [Aestuariibacter sp.]|nr:hypothetical protein [Aestuariibacter sp.]
MNYVRLNDLDELALTVRDPKAKLYITEAIDAYRGGAYRAAIVSVWIAVTFDIISKIRELMLQGDAMAQSLISKLDNAISQKNIKRLQSLENDLLDKALKDFEFLSQQEHSDLVRLKEDRNLCAHPAFVAEESLFKPEPERVRMHIVHAVRHLLQHQPVQGKAALRRLITDIKSTTFPNEVDTVCVFLNSRYLNRAKKVLVRNLIVILLKAILGGNDPDLPLSFANQMLLTIQAIARKYPEVYETQMSDRLSTIVDALEDSELPNVFQLLSTDARCWKWINEPSHIRLKSAVGFSVAQSSTWDLVFKAINIEELKPDIISAFNSLKIERQIDVIVSNPRSEFAEKAIEIYSIAASFRGAESLGASLIIPMISYFSSDEVVKILEAVKINDQIWYASGTPAILEELFDGTIQHISFTRNAWKELGDFLVSWYSRRVDQGWEWSDSNWKGIFERLNQVAISIPEICEP